MRSNHVMYEEKKVYPHILHDQMAFTAGHANIASYLSYLFKQFILDIF